MPHSDLVTIWRKRGGARVGEVPRDIWDSDLLGGQGSGLICGEGVEVAIGGGWHQGLSPRFIFIETEELKR